MPTPAELQQSCDAVLSRLKAERKEAAVRCLLCSAELIDYDDLVHHLMLAHAVYCTAPPDVSDVDGFVNHLRGLLHANPVQSTATTPEPVHKLPVPTAATAEGEEPYVNCPICHDPFAVAELEEHVTREGHDAWNARTIPTLRPFCLCADSISDGDVTTTTSSEADWVERTSSEREFDADSDFEVPWMCLFCPHRSSSCLAHMQEVHQFDLPASTRAHPDVRDEYDLIVLLNRVRRAIHAHRCPGCGFSGCEDPKDASGRGQKERKKSTEEQPSQGYDRRLAGESDTRLETLEAHLRAHPAHRLPLTIGERRDVDLIPFLAGDGLLSLVVTSGQGFLRTETADPDFPMVPTLGEALAAQRASEKSVG